MNHKTVLLPILALAGLGHFSSAQIASTSFEAEVDSKPGNYASTSSSNLNLNDTIALGNTDDDNDTVILNSTSASNTAGDIGFSTTFTNTRDDSGLSNGAVVGVVNNNSAPFNFTGRDGSNVFAISSPEGLLEVTFDTVDISSYANVTFLLDYAVEDTTYEPTDFLQIWYELDSGPRVNIVDLAETGLEAASGSAYTTASSPVLSGNNLTVGFNFDSKGEIASFDSFSVAIPESGAFALVAGIAGLGLVLSRRRIQ